MQMFFFLTKNIELSKCKEKKSHDNSWCPLFPTSQISNRIFAQNKNYLWIFKWKFAMFDKWLQTFEWNFILHFLCLNIPRPSEKYFVLFIHKLWDKGRTGPLGGLKPCSSFACLAMLSWNSRGHSVVSLLNKTNNLLRLQPMLVGA